MWTLSPQARFISDRFRAKKNEEFKARKMDPITDYELDVNLFKGTPFGHDCRHEYLLRLWGHMWPNDMVIEVDGLQNYWVVRMAKAFCKHKSLLLVGCASSGKSYTLAAYSYTMWKINAMWSSVYMSTTSAEAGEARAYGVAKRLHKRDRYKMGKLIDSLRVITLDEETRNEEGEKERDYANCMKAVLIKSGSEGKNVVGTICGRKNDVVLWSCDELHFMDLGALDARINLFSNKFAQFIGSGNGPEEGDPLYIDGEPFGSGFPDGWRSVDKDVHEGWPTRTGYCLYFNGERSPNIMLPKDRKPIFPALMDFDKMKEMERMSGGTDTPMYWKQVIGLPPAVDVPDKIITQKLLESNRALEQPVWFNLKRKTVAGLDLGFRDGGDPCVISFGQIGTEETGRQIVAASGDAQPILASQSSKEAFEKQIAKQVIDRCRERNCHDLALDVTGDGGILLQQIEREARDQNYQINIVAVSFSGTADDSVKTPDDKRLPTQIYANKVSQIWAQSRVCVINGVIRGLSSNHKAVRELCGRRFATDEKRRFLVEKKSDFKKRLRHSPDHADAVCLMIFMALKLGLDGEPLSEAQKNRQERERFEEQIAPGGYEGHATSYSGYAGH